MKIAHMLLVLVALLALLIGCGSPAAPTLAVKNQPTLVYIYTDG